MMTWCTIKKISLMSLIIVIKFIILRKLVVEIVYQWGKENVYKTQSA